MKKIILLPAILFVIVIGCSSAPESIPDQKQITFLTNGVWIGLLPCADCDGIDYTLNLKNDYTYKQRFVYKGKSEEQLNDEGTWSFDSDSVIQLESYDYAKMFLIKGKDLILLDQYGDRIKSDTEDKYHLHKDASTVREIKEIEEVKNTKPVEVTTETNSSFYQEKYLNGADFFAKGSEPNWTLAIDFEKSMSFAAIDDIKINTPAVEGIKAKGSDVTLYSAKGENGELVITVFKENCQDNMSGENFTYKVRVEFKNLSDENYKTFEGCGKFLYDSRLHDIWVLEEMTGVKLKKAKLTKGFPTFEFYPDEMRFSGHAGCNSISGNIIVIGNKITFESLIGTLTACPDMTVERAVVKALDQKTVTYNIDKLKLTLVSGKTKMIFKKAD